MGIYSRRPSKGGTKSATLVPCALVWLCSILLFAACSADDGNDIRQRRDEIVFTAEAQNIVQTRANTSLITGTAFSAGQSIGVMAYHHDGSAGQSGFDASSSTPNFMWNQKVAFDGGKWTYSPLKYWPNESPLDGDATSESTDHLSFIGYYPYNGAGITVPDNSTQGIGSYGFETQKNAADQIDFMLSDLIAGQTKQKTSGEIKLNFHHTLTQITTSYKAEGFKPGVTVSVSSITFSGIYSQGKCTPKYEGGLTSFSWDKDELSTPAAYASSVAKSGQTVPKKDVLLLIPQTFGAESEASLNVEYTVTTEGKTYSYSRSVRLNAIGKLAKWEMNHKYNYEITIHPDYLEVKPTLLPWTVGGDFNYTTEVSSTLSFEKYRELTDATGKYIATTYGLHGDENEGKFKGQPMYSPLLTLTSNDSYPLRLQTDNPDFGFVEAAKGNSEGEYTYGAIQDYIDIQPQSGGGKTTSFYVVPKTAFNMAAANPPSRYAHVFLVEMNGSNPAKMPVNTDLKLPGTNNEIWFYYVDNSEVYETLPTLPTQP